MQDINILRALSSAQVEVKQAALISEVNAWLNQDAATENSISQRIEKNSSWKSHSAQSLHLLDATLQFDLRAIEQVCTHYRLRFLESSLFKGKVPAEAIREARRIESASGITFQTFKILAPEERFHLKDSTQDPILMAELPNGKYYFIYQWGDDVKWYQYILKYPFRHMGALAVSSGLVAALISILVPSQFEGSQAEFFFRFFIFSMSTCLIMTLAIITAIMYSKDFSENVWNSKFIR